MSSIYLNQALVFAAGRPPGSGDRRPEAHLEKTLLEFWATWAETALEGSARQQAAMSSADWPGVGRVDLEVSRLVDGRAERTWIEVKWRDLWNCPWDVAKLALALRLQLCQSALLIAAAPLEQWSMPGSEFFSRGRWDMARDVLDAHRSSWLYWKRAVKTRPLRLPGSVETIPAGLPTGLAQPFRGWSLRAIELRDSDVGWIGVDEDRRGHPILE